MCAKENAKCSFTGERLVRYGANGKFAYRVEQNSVVCSNLVFGDPSLGAVKSCQTRALASSFKHCANENELCQFTGERLVRYGASGKYAYQVKSGSVQCSNLEFGDPAFLTAKSCSVATMDSDAVPAHLRQDPIIIIGGTLQANELSYLPLRSRLNQAGYQNVEIFILPNLGLQDIDLSARELDRTSDAVRQRYGSSKVDLIGHSQGGLAARSYITKFGGSSEVDSVISLGTPHKGADLFKLTGSELSKASLQMATGSDFVTELNSAAYWPRHAHPAISYTNFETHHDLVVTPHDNTRMPQACDREDSSGRVLACNVYIQANNQCPLRIVDHIIGLVTDATVFIGIDQALRKVPVQLALNNGCLAL